MPDTSKVPDLLAAHPGMAVQVPVTPADAYDSARLMLGARIAAIETLAQNLLARRILNGRRSKRPYAPALAGTTAIRDRESC